MSYKIKGFCNPPSEWSLIPHAVVPPRPLLKTFLPVYLILFALNALVLTQTCYADNRTIITSETLEYQRETETYIAKGKVKVQKADTVVEADELTYNENTSDVTASGNVKYSDGEVLITASRAELNLNAKTGKIYDAEVFYRKDNYRISGLEIEKRGKDYYFSSEASFTTCDGPSPAWCFKGKNVDAVVGDRLKARNASFRIKGVPVLYTPYLQAPILTERTTGLLMPLIAYSTSRGLHVNLPFYWAIAENRDATLILDEYTKRGLGEGIEYRYVNVGDVKGRWWLYHIRDSELDKDFTEFRVFHEQRSAEKIGGYLNVNFINEKDFYREFQNDIQVRTNRFLESTGEIMLPLHNSRAYLLSQYWIDLKEHSTDPAQRLPEAGYVLNPVEAGPFWVSAVAALSNFWREEEVHGQRFDVFPRISYMSGSDITVSQSLGFRETAYSLERGEDNSPHREALEYSITGHTRLFRKYQSFIHVLEPSVSYTFISDSINDVPVFDSAELYNKTSTFELSLLNRILDDKGEIIVFRVSQGFDSYRGDRPFFPLRFDMGIKRPVSLRVGAAFNVHTGELESTNSDIALKIAEAATFTAGQRYNRNNDVQTYVAGLGLHPFKPIYIDSSFWYDAEENETRDIALNVKYLSQCWGVNLGIVKREGDFSVVLLFELKGLTKALKI
jgi:LPS-assembly protein